MSQSLLNRLPLPLSIPPPAPPFPISSILLLCSLGVEYCIIIIIISLFIRLQLRADVPAYQPNRSIDNAWEGLTVTGTGIPTGSNFEYGVTCTAFPYVTLHSQPFPITRLVALLCYKCYFVPPNGLNRRAAYLSAHLRRSLN